MNGLSDSPSVQTHLFKDDGKVPNNPALPLLVYQKVIDDSHPNLAGLFEELYVKNGWQAAWRWSVYDYHHYHSTAHEALGCFRGNATVLFGGDSGVEVEISPGDLVVIPAGVGHKNLRWSAGFQVSGGYPPNQNWDMNYAKPEEHGPAIANIAKVPLPETDPLYGADGPLVEFWRSKTGV